jgi:alanine racemase
MAARISRIERLQPGDTVGYGREWTATEPTLVATIAAGYADGIHRAQGNRGSVVAAGIRCPILGRVSMDQISADVSATDGLNVGDPVTIVGGRPGAFLGADEVAAAGGTISYEVLTSISARVPRFVVE